MDGFSDRGSIPLTSILDLHVRKSEDQQKRDKHCACLSLFLLQKGVIDICCTCTLIWKENSDKKRGCGIMALTSKKLKEFAAAAGAHGCGIASINRFGAAPKGFSPADVYSGCKSVVVMYRSMPRGSLAAENLICYSHTAYKMYEEMERLSMEVIRYCESEGALAMLIPPDVPYLYWDAENMHGRGIISLKHAAVQAGLGIMGRSTIFITPEYGNMVYLGAVLLDTELEADPLMTDFDCPPGCTRCMDVCPQQAIYDGIVDQKLCRPNSNFQNERGFDLYTCNKCRGECPLRFGRVEDGKNMQKDFQAADIFSFYLQSEAEAAECRKKAGRS